jgi:hypothetical protein
MIDRIDPDPNKILALDIDGVMNGFNYMSSDEYRAACVKWPQSAGHEIHLRSHIDPKCVEILNRILVATNAGVVLCSTWRRMRETMFTLKNVGIDHWCDRYIDNTPFHHGDKDIEIRNWMEENQFKGKFAILEDDFLPTLKAYHFQTCPYNGLTNEVADAVIAHLNS